MYFWLDERGSSKKKTEGSRLRTSFFQTTIYLILAEFSDLIQISQSAFLTHRDESSLGRLGVYIWCLVRSILPMDMVV